MSGTNDEEVDPYELLGVTLESSEQDIRTAYRKLSLKVHPDRVSVLLSLSVVLVLNVVL